MITVLVVDDVAPMREQYAYDLRRLGEFESLTADGGQAALDLLLEEAVDCVILDLEMPGMDGFDLLRAMSERELRVPVIVYTGTGNYERCVQAVRLGAYAFIDKAESMEKVVHEIQNAVERGRLEGEVAALRAQLLDTSSLIGTSGPMRDLKAAMARLAPIPSPILVVGESGTGKELVARELHRLGPGERRPFIAVNCAALPENLIESELFGHERGAFTGAHQTRRGAFELAREGTLFLDEIAEMPAAAQAKLLRVLEEREIVRLGGSRTIVVDTRVVAATNRDLEQEVEAKRFRQDLLFRLNVHTLSVPPLRDRRSDVPDLVAHLTHRLCARLGIRPKTVEAEAVALLMAHDWRRNNVRELRNVVERMIIATDGDRIGVAAVPPDLQTTARVLPSAEQPRTFQERKAEAERQIVVAALERNDWHITNTAKELGLADHASLLKIMRRHGITSR
ncbi:MAG: sigma-54 dependent transcriptional regulator [Gemmatimonadota bacterium]|nr:sigma-54 dependent transcriptional regulator [Gemmatimonadota bacterium]MDH3366554.1 sigma-54 dependent transcriptional regulator [Gemmatimonadota bacterium]MDH3478477.1 sigma-54 dependent transcriptional regulator [Gemmatimonadota bacterium]MDH3571024.1 sigma-54 dependent transcriptional regulator [Gemmatimonadota bacterium]